MGSNDRAAARAREALGEELLDASVEGSMLTLTVRAATVKETSATLRDDPELAFEQLSDLCGIDYSAYGAEHPLGRRWQGKRFGVVYHLLSLRRNHRVRVRALVGEDEMVVPSVVEVWASADWFEREAFDLFGLVFEGHPDLRRILTDYGFIGHPFRKDFPLSGHVEMRYDPDRRRVVYQPVTIEPRVLVPRVIREEGFGDRDS